MIKAIIFDYNGVLTKEGHFEPFLRMYAQKRGKDEAPLQKLVREEWDAAREGQKDGLEVWRKAAAYLGVPFGQFKQEWEDHFPIRQEMLTLVGSLRREYKTALMTNMIQCWWEDINRECSLQDYFDYVFTSYKIGAAKPDTRIFESALERLGFKAGECLFIDNQIKSTSATLRLGFDAICFESVEQLQLELLKRGISV